MELIIGMLSLFLVLSLVTLWSQTKALEKMLRREERERANHKQTVQELIDRLMHKEGVTWTPPPRNTDDAEISEDIKRQLEGWKEV